MWKRKSHPNPIFKKYPKEDLFLCPQCNLFFPWYRYCKGKCLILGYDEPTYENMEKDIRWSCDVCIEKLVIPQILFT